MRSLVLVPLAVVATTLSACGSDDDPKAMWTDTGGPAPAVFVFSKDLGCGYGFARTDEHATQLLQVYYDGSRGSIDATVRLPDPHWTATIETGERLDANWCSDVIVDPQPKVDETWTTIVGTLAFVGGAPKVDGPADAGTVRAQLTGVIAESPDGDRVTLSDLPLRNRSFGLFAG